MSWERRREPLQPELRAAPVEWPAVLLEAAPVPALLLDADLRVLAANQAARRFFLVDADRLPASLVEVTRESRLVESLRAGRTEDEIRLAHRQRTVRTRLVEGEGSGARALFLTDVTELKRLETVRQEFVSNLSHELKTPITSLRLAAESLTGEPPPPMRRRFLARVMSDADHLAAIVDNLRELAQIESGSFSLNLERFGVAEMVVETAERVRLDRPIDIRVASGLEITADRAKLAQALSNLVDNAAKFSPPGSPIEVDALLEGQEFTIRVRDHGPGISPEHWERVFERFYKVDPARSRVVPGSGLGLAITKHLAMVQGGSAWTETHRDGGQVFALTIPLPEPAEGRRPTDEAASPPPD